MPSLTAEPELFPADVFEQGCCELDTVRREWWVFHTRPRCEKSIARNLLKQGVAYYLPQNATKRKHQRRWITTHLPLFPGYIFVYGDADSYQHALRTNQVVGRLDVKDQERLHSDLSQIYRAIQHGESLTPEDYLQPGTPVEIVHGSLAGTKGTVIRSEGRVRLLVGVQMLNRGLSVQVEEWMVQKI